MRVPWKWLGLAGAAGVAAGGVVVARKRRAHGDYEPEELRAKLHERLAAVQPDAPGGATCPARPVGTALP